MFRVRVRVILVLLTYLSYAHTHIYEKDNICNVILLDLRFRTRLSIMYQNICIKI